MALTDEYLAAEQPSCSLLAQGFGWDAFSVVGGGREVAREHPGVLGLAKKILGDVLGWHCTPAPWDRDGSGASLDGVYWGVGGLRPHALLPPGAVSGVPVASQPLHQNKPLGSRWKKPDCSPRWNINLSS